MVAGFDFLHDVAGRFVHIVDEFEFAVGVVSVLSVVVLKAQIVLVAAPAAQGFDGDVELGFDEVEVAVVLVEQVECLDFGIEVVFWGHGFSFCWGMIAQVF